MVPESWSKRYRCRLCGHVLPAWLPAAQAPDGALLLGHLSQQHPDQVGASLARMHTTEDITPVALEAYEVIEDCQAENP
jgi:hypothetical protein